MSTPSVSFEFFPPKSLQASFRLWDCVQVLAPFAPEFVSVTYGAGGTTRKLTHEAVDTIGTTTDLTVAAHLTCVDATREETLSIADSYKAAGVNHIVALRGDPPKGSGGFTPAKDGFSGSVELTRALADKGFDVTVGAYPEPHPDATNPQACIDHLKAKFDAGATQAITQFFFEPDTFLRFRDACADAGITAPILPGILPIENWTGIQKFAASCGAAIPKVLSDAFGHADTQETADLLAVAQASELCDDLLNEGVEHLHFYTLNKPELSRDICRALGLTPQVRLEKVA
ncbi:methylenetetrahydrofolate reductase [NAD(P)H] [Octadecabacter sp. 1_MG-2023]|uniref:methylenetetrahydrofolate reductase [NAD(P)H] n=1 Tax=unclassified Octadecabacter TaxID=196158 RepID=UPI001C08F78E|nr:MULTISPECIES: methylenetetrahydrofolate reductase [NAD(P)H] [unclassified Octadecabacter]MBU2992665.1 methylenetetrahydrofolate reductase [NAD(P)H] [Octadecabacter sp. B2R22]MDO6733884.1 methylenetetrahydrofolate reductase [NAD(P)H] [Octadecabacter sp. 1_MG-2023]